MDGKQTVKKAAKIAGTAADVTAMTAGGILRLAVRVLVTVLMVFIITALLFGFFYLLGQRKTYMEKQELAAFRSLADSYVYEKFTVDGERTAEVTDLGVTKDKDLYADFVITRYENDAPVTKQKARLYGGFLFGFKRKGLD